MAYEAETYWESLLSSQYDLGGVSHPTMPPEFLAALYRQMDRAVGASIVGRHARVIDIGSGTGHWLEFWRRHGAAALTAVELTEHASAQLRAAFPDVEVVQADIADTPPSGQFDAVSAMSILLHITDDDRVDRAVAHLAGCLAEGGVVYLMEPIRHNEWYGEEPDETWNSRVRSADWWEACLARHGLEVQSIRPVTAFLANAVDVGSRRQYVWANYWWRFLDRVMRVERGRRVTAAAVELVDRGLVKAGFGPSAKVLVARRTV